MNKDNILIINDVTGYGRVSSFAMFPFMTALGLHPYFLPTALVSNTMDYGNAVIMDTTDFMKDTIELWKKYHFTFNYISIGLMSSISQETIVSDLIKHYKPEIVMLDPIMADDDKLYPDMNESVINNYRHLLSLSNLVIPNYTEAKILANIDLSSKCNDNNNKQIINKFIDMGAKDVVITGCEENNKHYNLIFDSKNNLIQKIEYKQLPYKMVGTGDIFSATLFSKLIQGENLQASVRFASNIVYQVINENIENDDLNDLKFEKTIRNMSKEKFF